MSENTGPADRPAPPTPNPLVTTNAYPTPEQGPNWPLIEATRNLIASLPDADRYETDEEADAVLAAKGQAWNQSEWRCSTGMCFAGWASALTGAVFPFAPDDYTIRRTSDEGYEAARSVLEGPDGELVYIRDYARRVLGLGNSQADALFHGDNDLDAIDATITGLREGLATYQQLRVAAGRWED